MKRYDPKDKSGFRFTYSKFDSIGFIETNIESTYLSFKNDSTHRLDNYQMRKQTDSGKYELSYSSKLDTLFHFDNEDFINSEKTAAMLSVGNLEKFIEKEKERGSSQVKAYLIEKYQRTSMPFSTYILTFLAVAISYKKKRGGMGINLAIGILIVFVYVFFMRIFNTLAINIDFDAQIAVWVPNIIFSIISLIVYFNVRK